MAHKNKTAIVDFDDLCNIWDPHDLILELKERNPNFKCTLFTIPKLSSDKLIEKYKKLDFVELAMHGWHHTFCETWTWSDDMAEDKMKMAFNRGIDAKGFKAPKWVMHQTVYDKCRDLGWWIADHRINKSMWQPYEERVYCYNLKSKKDDGLIHLHGHTHNVMQNGIEEAFDSFVLPKATKYKFISELFKNGTI